MYQWKNDQWKNKSKESWNNNAKLDITWVKYYRKIKS